jgi:TP901 family phage tail tape measure protein
MASGNVAVRVGADIAEFQRKMAQVETKMKGLSRNLSAVGKKLTTRVTLPIIGMGTAIVTAGAKFEHSMSGVEAVTGATSEQMTKLNKVARELGATTEWSASQAADGMRYLGMAGFEVEEILEAMPGMLDLATAGQLDLARAADIASNVLTGFGMSASEVNRVADVLAKAAASANTNVEQLGYAMSYVAPVASGLGISLEEASAAIAIFSNAGIQGERAGTTLRQVLAQLAGPTSIAQKKLDALGISAEDINPELHSLADVIKLLRDHGVTASQAMDIFGTEAGTGLATLLQIGEGELLKYEDMLKSAGGTAQDMANIMRSDMVGGFKELLSALESVAISFYQVMRPSVEKVTEVLTRFARYIDNMSPEVKKSIVMIAGLFAVGGPLMLAISGFITLVTTAFGPVGLIAAAIIGLVYVWQRWGEDIKACVSGVVEAFRGMWNDFLTIKDNIVGAVESLWEKVSGVFGKIKDTIIDTSQAIKDNTIGIFGKMKDGIVDKTQGAVNKVKDAFQWLGDKLVWHSIVPDIVEKMQEVFGKGFADIVAKARAAAQQTADEIAYITAQVEWAKRYMGQGGAGTKADEYTGIDEARRIGQEVAEEMEKAKQVTDDVGDSFDDLATKSDLWTQSLADGIADAIVEGRSLLDVLQEIGKAILKSTISRALPGLFGIGIGGWHAGGVIGQDQPTFMRGIKSYDTGGLVGAGEELAILHQGEAVFTPAQLKALGSVAGGENINVTMNVNAVDSRSFVEMMSNNRAVVESIIIDNVTRNGKVRRAIKGAV